jgi:hypothetical protein
MGKNEILEANKLIAIFMGWIKELHQVEWKSHYYPPNHLKGDALSDWINRVRADGMKFHSSWEWLMPVMEKISKYVIEGYPPFNSDQFVRVEIVPNGYVKISDLRDTPITTNVSVEGGLLNATFKAAVKFVEWHNKNVEAKNVQPGDEVKCGVGKK